jgi:cell division protein FtsI (penicillin-binding protein 3)
MAISLFMLMFSAPIIRLTQIMIMNCPTERHRVSELLSPPIISRADIVDRNRHIIATSLPTVSLYACPHEIIDVPEAITKICNVFKEIDPEQLQKKLSATKTFVWIKRHLSPRQEQAVLNQGIPGLHFLKTEKRVYPDKNLLSHVLGGTDIDNIGIAGIEKVFDEGLRSSEAPLTLSINMKVQHAVRDELQNSMNEFGAIGGAAIVMKVSTGEIMAMASIPDFDPNKNSDPRDKSRFNLTTSSAIEPGSSAKIFNTAMALETGRITPFTRFDARNPLQIGRFTVHDFKPKSSFLSVEEILKFSSNIGSAKIALDVGASAQKKFFQQIGALDPIYCELPDVQHPLYPRNWSNASAATISFGHGIALAPLHLLTIFAGIVNGGTMTYPTLLKRTSPYSEKKIISSKTSKQIRALLRIAVVSGTNKQADVPGYQVGGKSGTAEKQSGGRYLKHSNYCAFMGAFPIMSPEYAIYVILDDPKASKKTYGYATAGWNANPTAARIIKRIGPLLGVMIPSITENLDLRAVLEER